MISIEIIGAYFIRGLERSTINTFIKDMNQTVESLATTISPELNRKDNADDEEVNANIKRFIENSATSDIIEIRVVDEKGIIRGTTDVNEQSAVGKKNDYVDINDFTTKRYVALDNDDKRVNINVQPILSRPAMPLSGLFTSKVISNKNIRKSITQQSFSLLPH